VSIIDFQCSTDSSRKPRFAPKPAFAKRLLVAAELVREAAELVLGAGGEDDAVAELDRTAGGGGANAGAGAGDHEDGSILRHAAGGYAARAWRPSTQPRLASPPCRPAPATTRAST
jgi:hypothetical protein